MPAIVEVSVIPVGTGNCSIGDVLAETLKTVKSEGVKFQLNAMGTILEGDLDDLLGVARKMHEVCFEHGAQRAVTIIKIDDRRDKELTMEYKVDSVLERAK